MRQEKEREQRMRRRKLRGREGREMGEESKRAEEKENILPEWFSNRAHAQHNVEIVSYPLN